MKWLFKPRLSVFDGLLIAIGAILLANDFVILGLFILTAGPLTSIIMESSTMKTDIERSEGQ